MLRIVMDVDRPVGQAIGIKEALAMDLERYGDVRVVSVEDIEDAPAADVSPVVHGRWEYIPQTLNTLSQFRCPFCRWWSLDPSIDGAYNYCPNCGAKMQEVE